MVDKCEEGLFIGSWHDTLPGVAATFAPADAGLLVYFVLHLAVFRSLPTATRLRLFVTFPITIWKLSLLEPPRMVLSVSVADPSNKQ